MRLDGPRTLIHSHWHGSLVERHDSDERSDSEEFSDWRSIVTQKSVATLGSIATRKGLATWQGLATLGHRGLSMTKYHISNFQFTKYFATVLALLCGPGAGIQIKGEILTI